MARTPSSDGLSELVIGLLGLGVSDGLVIPVSPGLIEKGNFGDSCTLISFCVRSSEVPLPRLLLRKSRWLISNELTCLMSGISKLLVMEVGVAPRLDAGAFVGVIAIAIEPGGEFELAVSCVSLLPTPRLTRLFSVATLSTGSKEFLVASSDSFASYVVEKSRESSEEEGFRRGGMRRRALINSTLEAGSWPFSELTCAVDAAFLASEGDADMSRTSIENTNAMWASDSQVAVPNGQGGGRGSTDDAISFFSPPPAVAEGTGNRLRELRGISYVACLAAS